MQRHAVVTGGGSGIGLAIAGALHGAGHRVSIIGRNLSRLEQAAASLPGTKAVVCDVTDDEAVVRTFAAVGPVDILINNAGGVESRPFERTTLEQWRSALSLNLLSSVRTISAAAPGMKSRGFGRIVNIASTAGLKGYSYVSAYVSAKHGLIGLTRALAFEYAKSGVTINALCPGYTDTEIIAAAVKTISSKSGRSEEEARSSFAQANPQGRLISPDEVAASVLWLTSPGAEGVNGAAIPISGGEI